MRIAPTFALTLALLIPTFPTSDALAAAPGVAAARDRLEKARAALAKAVKAVEKDPPSNADLEAARAAVEALKDAIDAGVEFEPKDLDYAKAVLTARKELRSQRDYVEDRRAKIHIFEHRRTIDAALGTLDERSKRAEGKAPTAKDFQDARAAVEAVRKAAAPAREFTAQDEGFARYLTEVDAKLVRTEKALEDREVQLAVEKQRGVLDQGRQALSAAVGKLSKGASDAQFEAADQASADLAKRLDGGKELEAKDRGYRGEADKARAELAQSRKRIDELFSATGVERLKKEIEPARRDLVAAGKAARAKGATEDQMAEARTAAIVVRKLLEKFAPQAARSQAFGQYVEGVHKSLLEVEAGLIKRALLSASAGVSRAMRKVESAKAADAEFKEADAALAELEKALEGAKDPDPSVEAHVYDAKVLLRDSRGMLARRRAEASLGSARATLAEALKPLEGKEPTDEQFAEASTALTVLEKTLEKVEKTRDTAVPVADATSVLRSAKSTLTRRRAEVSLGSARAALHQALRAVEGKAPTAEQFAEANTALTVLEKTLEKVEKAPETEKARDAAEVALRETKARVEIRRVEASLEGPQAALTSALRKVEAKAPTDADFKEAEAALVALQKAVDATVNPPKAVAEQVSQAKWLLGSAGKTVERRRAEASLASARSAVTQAMRPIGLQSPTDEHFAEVNTALAILEKTLETVKTREAAAAVAEAKATLRDARAEVAKRRVEVSLEGPKAAVLKALARVERDAPSDEDFKQVEEALKALEKTLQDVGKPPKSVASQVGEARWLLQNTRKTVDKRRLALDVGAQRAKVEDARQDAAPYISELSRADHDQVKKTEAALKQIIAALDAGQALAEKDRGYAVYDIEVRKRVVEMNEKVARRKVVLAGQDGRELLVELVSAARSKLQTARQPASTDGELEAAAKGIEAIDKAMEQRAELEAQEGGYAAQADKTREELSGLRKSLELARRARELRRRTVDALAAGIAAANAASSASDLRAKKASYDKAVALFGSCHKAGAAMLEEHRGLVDVTVLVDGRPSTPKEAIALCAERAKSTGQLQKQVEGLVGFEDGPKRAYERARSLLGQKKKAEARQQFGECISSGAVLQHWHPELKERRFDVEGGSYTVGELIKQCTAQRDALGK